MNPYRELPATAVAIFLVLALPSCNKPSSPIAPAFPVILVPPAVQLSGEWRGTISNTKDPMDDPAPCPESEEIAGQMEQSGPAVSADLSGKCNRVHFEGLIEGGSLTGKITLMFPQEETFTGSATGMASPFRVQLNATLRSQGHTIPGFQIVLTR